MRAEAAKWVARGIGLAIGVLFVLILSALVISTRDVVLLVFIAVLLGAALEPVVGAIRSRIPIGRGLAILVVYAAFLALVIAISVFVVPTALVQLSKALASLPAFLQQVRTWTNSLQPEALSQGLSSLLDAVEAPFKPGPPPDPQSIIGVSLVVFQAAAAVVTLLALVFFWLTERPRLQRYALAFAPADRRGGIRDAWNEVESRLGLWVRGQLTLMATIGVATGIAYSVIGLPAALLLALIAAIMEVIPIVGPLLGAIPAVLVATSISTETALITMGIYLLLQIIEGNVLVPIVMRNSVGLSPFLVLLSLLVGGTAGGILGAVVAVPVVAGITVVLERLQDRETPVPIDPAAVQEPDEAAKEAMAEHGPSSKGREQTGTT
ncbi:MAG TPA: AI-2E family transporter [Candidatus Limnocylindrales bacterium]|jgi:predicted PurR-regulated permease PerM|nr:AI-2E family transporter [Candidatus Limnocylindrales bacterium]